MSGTKYIVELDEDDLAALNWTVQQLPAIRLMNVVNAQVQEQNRRRAEPPAPTEPPKRE